MLPCFTQANNFRNFLLQQIASFCRVGEEENNILHLSASVANFWQFASSHASQIERMTATVSV